MRIFETYSELCAALDLPADHPAAYRFTKSYGVAGFHCDHCGAVKTFPLRGCGTGYGVTRGLVESMHCYQCCIDLEIEKMRDHAGPFYAYVNGDKRTITAWPGGELARITAYSESRSGWNRSTIARFTAIDKHGQTWHGRGAGAGMACTLRRAKK